MVLFSSISFLEFGFQLQVQTITSLFLGGLLCVTSATKQEEVKRLPGGKIKKKVSALQIFLPFDVYEQALLHETNNGVFVVGKH